MEILITGGLGHIGSYLIRYLFKKNNNIKFTIIDNLSTQRYCSLFNLPKKLNYEFIEADCTKKKFIQNNKKFSFAIHLAASTNAEQSLKNKNKYFTNNLGCLKNVSEYCTRNKIKLIHISSTSVYGAQNNIVDESSKKFLNPQSPYAECKILEENYLNNLSKKNKLKFTILRFGTIYGISPGMRFHTAINKFCWQSFIGVPLTIWKTAYNQKRPYLDIDDASSVIYHIIFNDIFKNDIYNVLTFNASVKQIVNVIKSYNSKLKIKFINNKIMNQLSFEVSNKKIINTGWKTKSKLNISIKKYFTKYLISPNIDLKKIKKN